MTNRTKLALSCTKWVNFGAGISVPRAMATRSATRRLAAILAADVAGYSRLMGADEEGTHQRLQAHFRQLVDPKIAEHRGRIVKNTGDGLLAEFPSVVDAVRCAAEVQRGMLYREPDVPDDRRIRFRIGVNLGDVIAEGGDIFGDGVNVAARLEALAAPGGICVSRTVHEQIRSKLHYTFADLVVHDAGNADPARLGERFQARGDIDSVAKDVAALGDHVTEIDPDAEPDAAVLGQGRPRGRSLPAAVPHHTAPRRRRSEIPPACHRQYF